MAESIPTPEKPKATRKPRNANDPVTAGDSMAADVATPDPKAKFAKAIEEAKAGAQALGKQAQDTAEAYRGKVTDKTDALLEDAKAMSGQAKDKAASLAREGKARTVEGISTVSKLVADNAPMIDEKLGPKYGDYARSAAKSLEDTAAKLESKDIAELGEDAREMVRKSPGLAVGIAAAAGFFLARMFRGSGKSDS
jgi:ElaB/YqjD/DUF883 family membrane-anchored ribosome-binding protein